LRICLIELHENPFQGAKLFSESARPTDLGVWVLFIDRAIRRDRASFSDISFEEKKVLLGESFPGKREEGVVLVQGIVCYGVAGRRFELFEHGRMGDWGIFCDVNPRPEAREVINRFFYTLPGLQGKPCEDVDADRPC
jgi:hypothetical protein